METNLGGVGDDLGDLPKQLRGPVGTYGRAMVALVYGAGMASEATKVLALRAQSQRDTDGLHAVRVLSETFNEMSTAYCKVMGWTEAMLMQCDRDISLSFAGAVVDGKGLIILDA